MIYPYTVVRNGKKYPPGTDVPENDVEEVIEEPTIEEPPAEIAVEEEPEPNDEKPIADPEEEVARLKTEYKPVPQYNKNTINRMSVADLRTVALESGIKDVVEKTGAQLKRELIELFGL